MELAIKEWCEEKSYTYESIPESSIKYVYDLCCHNIINEPITDIEMLYLGSYYKTYKDYENMKKYYLMAIEKYNPSAMYNLGYYYQEQEDYENMKKYFLMASEKGNSYAMYNLGYYYKKQKDYDNMKQYYLMAIDKGYSNAMNNLGYYYKEQKDYENMLKYYLIAIEKGNSSAMSNLGVYYRDQEDYENMIKYYLMAIEKGHANALATLEHYYNSCCNNVDHTVLIDVYYKLNNTPKLLDILDKYLLKKSEIDIPDKILEIIINLKPDQLINASMGLKLLVKSIKTQIDTLDLHFKYAPTGEGFNEAKKHYYAELKNTT